MKISIIIPTYNRINFLAKALQSISSQTYRNYEIIIVNDNPADKSRIDKLSENLTTQLLFITCKAGEEMLPEIPVF